MSENESQNPGTPADGRPQPEAGAVPPRPVAPPTTPSSGPDAAQPVAMEQPAADEGRAPVDKIEGAADQTQSMPRHTAAQQDAAGPQQPVQQPAYGQAWNAQGQHSASPYGSPTPEDHAAAFAVPPAQNNSPKKFTSGALIVGMVAAALVGAGGAVGANYVMSSNGTTVSSSTQTPQGDVVINNPENVTAVTAAAAKASPSVVTIDVSGSGSAGSGSGIILDTAGHILTNTHVVTLGGTTGDPSISVRTSDGKVHNGSLVGTDPLSDLAVIKIDAPSLVPATLGASSELNVGDTAVAIGAPLGLSGTVTDGIISTLNRTISVASSAVPEQDESAEGDGDGNQFNFQFPGVPEQQSGSAGSIFINVIQTDAAINHGNSGGALVDVNGDIIGVNVAIASSGSGSEGSSDGGSIGVGFAIPIDYAKRIADDIIADGSASHGMLGVEVLAKPASVENGGSSSFSVGAEVKKVVADSPAAAAGLEVGDVITGVDARTISDSTSLTAAIRELPSGGKAEIHYIRGGNAATANVTVGESPAS
ncbi:trypsin-like peptidase domain-containing protein [Paeniglutamicibacter sp. ZC-3]|uniref:S1C family serine protease n=1 Tax=Paeniglutamicibacter sp. ZC-3 TaxID=2986919 RepID=UPI0021F7E5E0|nr:trypsin-like peptidase domain-containing protein [Paeniglutamicibacter sp. ZC-3]MCV9995439.1 trypsin-like peptidase domain-containing protein [Paeniglutamicibacter sp. ZC-3]